MTAPEPLRALSGVEAELARTHARSGGGAQVTTLVTVAAAFGSGYLTQAVARWSGRFPVLSALIGEEGGALWFRRDPGAAPVRPGEEEMPACRTPADLLAQEAGTPLRAGGPLWRLRIVHDRAAAATHFLLTCHPAVCDGHTAGRLVRGLLDVLFGEEPDRRGPRPYAEQLLPDCDGLSYRAPSGAAAPAPAGWPEPEPVTGPVPDPAPGQEPGPEPVPQRVWPLALSPQQSALLKRWCAEQHVGVDQFLAVLLAACFTRVTGHDRVDVLTAVSLRLRYAESVRLTEAGCCTHALRTPLRITDGTPAGHARAHGAALAAADAAWRPPRADAGPSGTATGGRAGGSGTPRLRLSWTGSADTVLGGHAGRVTELASTVGLGTHASGSLDMSVLRGGLRLVLSLADSADGRRVAAELARELATAVGRPGTRSAASGARAARAGALTAPGGPTCRSRTGSAPGGS